MLKKTCLVVLVAGTAGTDLAIKVGGEKGSVGALIDADIDPVFLQPLGQFLARSHRLLLLPHLLDSQSLLWVSSSLASDRK